MTVRELKIGSWEIGTVVKTLMNFFKPVKNNPGKTKLIPYSSVKLNLLFLCDIG